MRVKKTVKLIRTVGCCTRSVNVWFSSTGPKVTWLLMSVFAENDGAFLDSYRKRAFVTNISYDYCIAQNDMNCGNNLAANDPMKAQLIRQNGGNTNYDFGLIVLPQN